MLLLPQIHRFGKQYGTALSDIVQPTEELHVDENYVLHLPPNSVDQSPPIQITKVGSPSKLIARGDIQCESSNVSTNPPDIHLNELVGQMRSLLLTVAPSLDDGHIDLWLNFFQLINHGKFPLDNIAYQLFLFNFTVLRIFMP